MPLMSVRPAPTPRAIPAEFGADAIVWAAWLYYVDGLTQSGVAAALGVSRASVVAYLQAARERGVVRIAIDPDALAGVTLARRLAARFGLKEAHVIPDLAGEGAPLTARLGAAGARLLLASLAESDVLGVAWGRTVLAVARALPHRAVPGLTVAQVAGSAIGTAAFSPELCTSVIANRLAARCVNLHAPAVLSSAEVRDLLLREPAITRQFDLIRACTKILFGIGDVLPTGTAFASGFVPPEAGQAYLEGGAVAVVIGQFIDAAGRHVPGPLDGRLVGITLDELRRVPERICVAGGAEKATAMQAALTGGFATHLVTDAGTAALLFEGG
ncbi:MAG: sugar-binding transcriptional regulator [Geminicoccaceae bacterium]|nr:sugar-binding transcriptional regulator [Geminicoccaceae bacterium]